MEGHAYAVCAGNDFDSTKCGYTTQEPFSYLRKNYARTMIPLNIRRVLQVPKAKLSEDMLFAVLEPARKDPNHEIFDLSEELLQLSFDSIKDAFKPLCEANSRMILPEYVSEAEKDIREKNAIPVTELKKREAQQRKVQRLIDHNNKMQSDKQKKIGKKSQLAKALKLFLESKCDMAPAMRLPTSVMLDAFNKYLMIEFPNGQVLTHSQEMAELMAAEGFIKKVSRYDKDSLAMCFQSLSLKQT